MATAITTMTWGLLSRISSICSTFSNTLSVALAILSRLSVATLNPLLRFSVVVSWRLVKRVVITRLTDLSLSLRASSIGLIFFLHWRWILFSPFPKFCYGFHAIDFLHMVCQTVAPSPCCAWDEILCSSWWPLNWVSGNILLVNFSITGSISVEIIQM